VSNQRGPGQAGFGRFLWMLGEATIRHDIASLAAVIAFYGLFSVFPLLLLLLYGASWLLPHWYSEQAVLSMIRPYFPTLPNEVVRNWDQLMSAGARVGLISAISLLWSAGSGFIAVQQALDIIWEVAEPRSYLSRRLMAFGMLMVLLLLTVLSAIGTALLSPLRSAAAGFPAWVGVLHTASRFLFPLSVLLGLLVFYRYLPSRSMAWRHLIPAALIATAALDGGRKLFVGYAGHLVTYQLIYGSLAAVMLFVLWVYIASILMLFGAEVARALERWTEAAAG
jgi:membrane protein